MFSSLESQLQISVENLVAENDRVVAQVRARATTSVGKVYNNGLLMLFTLRDGRIAGVREYADLLTAIDVFG